LQCPGTQAGGVRTGPLKAGRGQPAPALPAYGCPRPSVAGGRQSSHFGPRGSCCGLSSAQPQKGFPETRSAGLTDSLLLKASVGPVQTAWKWGRLWVSARAVALIYNRWSLFAQLAHPPARGHHQPAVVARLGGRQDRTCRPDHPHAHRLACPFRPGQSSPDACLCLASRLDRLRCGAVEPIFRLAPRLRPLQAPPRRCQAAPISPAIEDHACAIG
jgi:hypothetical protein